MGKEKEILDNAEYEVQQGLSEVKRLINSMGNYSGGMLVRDWSLCCSKSAPGMEGSSYTINMNSQPFEWIRDHSNEFVTKRIAKRTRIGHDIDRCVWLWLWSDYFVVYC